MFDTKKIIIILVVLMFSNSCGTNDFRGSCIKAAKILSHAKKNIKLVKVFNNEVDGQIISTSVHYDNSEYISFMENNLEDLKKQYDKISKYFEKSGEYYMESLFALTLINIHIDHYMGKTFDDKQMYIDTIKQSVGAIEISKWMFDDFFGPLVNNKVSISEWGSMNGDQKLERVLFYIFSFDKSLLQSEL